jgi:hypothetical protein
MRHLNEICDKKLSIVPRKKQNFVVRSQKKLCGSNKANFSVNVRLSASHAFSVNVTSLLGETTMEC